MNDWENTLLWMDFIVTQDRICMISALFVAERQTHQENMRVIFDVFVSWKFVCGSSFIPDNLTYTKSLQAFKNYYVNKYVDHHAYEIAY